MWGGVVTANNGDNTVSVFLGNGNGTFQARTDYETGVGPSSVVAADLNDDGVPDVITGNCGPSCGDFLIGTNSVSVLPGSGGGALGAHPDYETGDSPHQVVVGDFNNDGKADLAVGRVNALTVSVLLNTASTHIMLTSSPNPSHHGQTVPSTATVTPTVEGAGTPTGTVAFINGPTILGSATLSDGVAVAAELNLDRGHTRDYSELRW
jgi:hypothetical protein